MKYFIITIDTEGDNLWQWDKKSLITTKNTLFLSRFQNLCEKYGFKPVWLTNFEMINDPNYVDFINTVEQKGTGEIGMHLHAWNTPPEYTLPFEQTGLPYLIEYPEEIMRKKVESMTTLIKSNTGITPVSHRAGRWAIDDRYFRILKDYGYKVDCSVTPHINWQHSPGQTYINGSDYSNHPEQPYWIDKEKKLLEVPVSIRKSHSFILPENLTLKDFLRSCKRTFCGQYIWLRPNGQNEKSLLHLIDLIYNSNSDYIMFMLHSSELMPNGNPTFRTNESIEMLYKVLDTVFYKASNYFTGITLRDYYNLKKEKDILD